MTLAPAGGFPSASSVIQALKHRAVLDALDEALRREIGASCTIFFGSGTQALFYCFTVLAEHTSRRLIAINAYTCPDIAAAAVRAGFTVLPLESKPGSLEAAPDQLGARGTECAAVVLSNLYGLPEELAGWKEEAARSGFLLIDDASQSLLSARRGQRVGTEAGTIGITSFGRGKACCAVGGGALFLNDSPLLEGRALDAARWESALRAASPAHRGTVLRPLIVWLLSQLFERPWLYAVPARLPFLKLGETICDMEFSLEGLSRGHACVALATLQEATQTASTLRRHATELAAQLKDSSILQPFTHIGGDDDPEIVPIRYPLIFPDAESREAAFEALSARGLGASRSYPRLLGEFEEFHQSIVQIECPNARELSRRILTVPLHRHVRLEQLRQIADTIRGVR